MSNPTEPADPSRKCCDGCTSMIRLSDSNARASFDPTTAAINLNNVTKPSCNEGCCSGNKHLVEAAAEDDCCGGNEQSIEDKYQDICCSGEEKEAADDGCQDSCCSGENEKSNGYRGLSACCEGKASPCCDGENVVIRIIVSILICPQHHASTESRCESAKAIVKKTQRVTGFAPRVRPARLIRSAPITSTRRSWLPLIASAGLLLLSAKSLAASQRHNLLCAKAQ